MKIEYAHKTITYEAGRFHDRRILFFHYAEQLFALSKERRNLFVLAFEKAKMEIMKVTKKTLPFPLAMMHEQPDYLEVNLNNAMAEGSEVSEDEMAEWFRVTEKIYRDGFDHALKDEESNMEF